MFSKIFKDLGHTTVRWAIKGPPCESQGTSIDEFGVQIPCVSYYLGTLYNTYLKLYYEAHTGPSKMSPSPPLIDPQVSIQMKWIKLSN